MPRLYFLVAVWVLTIMLKPIWEWLDRHQGAKREVVIAVFIAALLALGGGLWATFQWLFTPSEKLALTMFIDCPLALLPISQPAAQWFYVLDTNSDRDGEGLQESYSSGAQLYPGKDTKGQALRCELKQYSSQPLFAVKFIVVLSFMPAIPQEPGAEKSGPVNLVRQRRIEVPILEPGLQGGFVFYITNIHDEKKHFVSVGLPTMAMAKLSGESMSQAIGISSPTSAQFRMILTPPTVRP